MFSEAMTSLPPGMPEARSRKCVCVLVAQVRVDVDLLLDPGCEVRHVAVNSGS